MDTQHVHDAASTSPSGSGRPPSARSIGPGTGTPDESISAKDFCTEAHAGDEQLAIGCGIGIDPLEERSMHHRGI